MKEGMTVATCEYCGTEQTLPRLDDDRKANLYDRARLRMKSERQIISTRRMLYQAAAILLQLANRWSFSAQAMTITANCLRWLMTDTCFITERPGQ